MTPLHRILLGMFVLVASALAATAMEWKLISSPHVAPLSAVTNAPPVRVPVGSSNLALLKPVSAGPVLDGFHAALSRITDGFKENDETNYVELPKKAHWVQIDLQQPSEIHAVVIWKPFERLTVARAVVVQICNDPDFKKEVQTLFNNDYENLNDLEAGTDQEYYETRFGKVIPAGGKTARYVRVYSRGTHEEPFSTYIEVEVGGLPSNHGNPASDQRAMEPLKLQLPRAVFL